MISDWVLPSCPVRARTWRRFQAHEFLPIAAAEAKRLNVVRPSNVSGLDELGVPCWQVVRPHAVDTPGNVTVLTGKGWTDDEALLGAYMEAIERHWAERCCLPTILAKPSELRAKGVWHVPLGVMPLPTHVPDPGDETFAWIQGTTLEGKSILVPAHDVLCPYSPPPGVQNPPIWQSTGLASGSHLTEAVFHGLLEIIERDAMAVAELCHIGQTIDLTEIGSKRVQDVIAVVTRLGITLEVKSLPSIGGVQTFVAFLDDTNSGNPLRINGGHSAHLDPLVAIEEAILEAVQSRAVFVAGAREDLDRLAGFASLGYSAARNTICWWVTPGEEKAPAPLAPRALPVDLSSTLRELAACLSAEKFWPIIFIPLSPPDAKVIAVRVIVPTASQASAGNVRLGRSILARAGATNSATESKEENTP